MPNLRKRLYLKSYRRELDNVGSVLLRGLDPVSGIADHVALPNLGFATNPTITVEAWVWVSPTATGLNTFYAHGALANGQSFACFYKLPDAQFFIDFFGTGTAMIIRVPANEVLGKWVHFAATYDGTTRNRRMYINGNLVGSDTTPLPNIPNTAYSIGRFINNGSAFNGNVDEVRIWATVRTEDQIRDNMNRTLTGLEPNLRAYYRFDILTGTTAIDSSPNGNNGTLNVYFGSDAQFSGLRQAPIYKNTLAGVITEFNMDGFTQSVNSGAGTLKVRLPRKFDDFGENTKIGVNYLIEVYVRPYRSNQSTMVSPGLS